MIIPAGHKVLIEPKAVETRTASGIVVMTDEQRELAATVEGVIVALGETAYLKVDDGRHWVKPGDRVLYAKYAGAMAVDPDTSKTYVVVHDVDIVCIIKETKGE
jgi:co-chaperonin GroES (HSP10)